MSDIHNEVNEVSSICRVVGSLLLQEPTPQIVDFINKTYDVSLEFEECKQTFFDTFCFQGSSTHYPMYEHVIKAGKQKDNGAISFPRAKHDGGSDVEAFYSKFDFDLADLNVAVPLRGKFIPGDHIGIMLAFFGYSINIQNLQNEQAVAELRQFANEHFDSWVETYAGFLANNKDEYLKTIGTSILEATTAVRSILTP